MYLNHTTNDAPKLCECGCGLPAPIAKLTDARRDHIKGQPTRFISGHNTRIANPSPAKPTTERFWKYVTPSGRDACWLWQGSIMPNGYGRLKIAGHSVGAHRVAWKLHYGEIPNDLQVLHKCDNPPCCNPNHLFLGTGIDNMQDKITKGRANSKRGETNHNAKVTAEAVKQIRNLSAQGMSQREIGDQFGIGQSQVHRIVHGKRWRHVT